MYSLQCQAPDEFEVRKKFIQSDNHHKVFRIYLPDEFDKPKAKSKAQSKSLKVKSKKGKGNLASGLGAKLSNWMTATAAAAADQ